MEIWLTISELSAAFVVDPAAGKLMGRTRPGGAADPGRRLARRWGFLPESVLSSRSRPLNFRISCLNNLWYDA
jgi:hypothetical protein